MSGRIPLAVIAGPTASGKTALAVELCLRLGGEVVCADSMQIYKKMSIATAKPTPEEMKGVKHHLVDFLEPSESFSVADYVLLAHKAAADIYSRGKLPVVCGGTGLYISSLTDNLQFEKTCSETSSRASLKALADERGGGYLLEILRGFDPETAERLHENNVSRIIRAIEVYETTGKTMSEQIKNSRSEPSPYNVCFICLDYRDREILYSRISERVDKMLENGLLEEAREFFNDSTLKTSRQAIGYKELAPYFEGTKTLDECIESLKQATRRYAKRQLTWFRRCENVNYIYPDECGSFENTVNEAAEIIAGSGIWNTGVRM